MSSQPPRDKRLGESGHPSPSSPAVHPGKQKTMGKLLSQHHRNPEAASSGSRCCLMQELGSQQEFCSSPGRPHDQAWHTSRGRGSESWHQGLYYMDDFDTAGQDCSSSKLLSEGVNVEAVVKIESVTLDKLGEAENPLAVVFDGGSRYFKVGYGGEQAPQFVFPCVVGRYKRQSVMVGMDARDTFIGNEVTNKQGKLTVKYPMEHGIVTNWDDMEKIWHHAFYNMLHIDPEEHPLLMTETIANPKANKEKLIQIMFETFRIPALYVAIRDVLSLFSSGRTTGLVVHSGDEVTYAVPIDSGYILSDAIMRLEISGRDLSMYLTKILIDKGYSLRTLAEWEMVRTIKEKLCYVALDYIEETQMEESSIEKKYELPDGRIITMGRERFHCPEAMFEPSLLEITSPGLHQSIYESLLKCDFEIRKIFYVNTLLCGGNMSFPGLTDRVAKEIKAQAPKMTKIKVIVPAESRFSSWFGGSILTSLNSFQHMWIYNHEYEELGPTIIHRRCF
ncbi:actin, cytoplasmic-like isoform X2 [Notamacropus eugenii]|uniref:actin, cytoplasmic-like isoform X2 n=1 Tax=Notamacropus eugenii TaxID=9315 RepID=UPI003B66E723